MDSEKLLTVWSILCVDDIFKEGRQESDHVIHLVLDKSSGQGRFSDRLFLRP